ncbi:MAG: OmpP1/FadL family transporter [Polyangiales bacterium]
MRARSIVPLLLSLLVLGPPAAAEASPQDLFGYGGRTPGLAMTGASYADTYEAVYANPAGLARIDRSRVTAGLHGASFETEVDGEPFFIDSSRGFTLGLELPLPFGGVLEDRLAVGIAFFTPTNVLLRSTLRYPDVPQFPVLDRTGVVAAQVGLGIDLHGAIDGLRLGVAFSATASTIGALEVGLNEAQRFESITEVDLIATFSPIVGLSYDIGDFAFGLVYRGEIDSVNSLDIETFGLPVELPLLELGGHVQYDPPVLALEASWMATPQWRLIAQGTARFWGAYPGAIDKTTASSNEPPDHEFEHTLSPRLAVEHVRQARGLEWALRLGYAWEHTPAPPARNAVARDEEGEPRTDRSGEVVRTPLRYFDNDRHVVTGGLGFELFVADHASLHLDLYGQIHVMPEREHLIGFTDDSPPATTRGVIAGGGWTAGLSW